MNNEVMVNSIKLLCKNNNISASQLEKDVGLSQGLISKWQKTMPSLDKIIDIANYFNVSIDDVVGRNKKQEELIQTLLQLTIDKVVNWKDDDIERSPLDNIEDLFSICYEENEIYYAKYEDGYFYLFTQYETDFGIMENKELQLYIQPDINSNPVLQTDSYDELKDLWLIVRESTRGLPDEYKAEKLKNSFLSKYKNKLKK
ncbi:DNA-binding transcriptional regulator, XRE-family HTH domain [Lacrimispora sphenoides]|uniref:helix-turn-helix domain-containing protein n=1 Tax=Lacrimispora sphenoides TaxID=29370 RepID=UPI0008B4FD2E|nr:helix-turn-helix transcriptional regulator [Lacrimispora sphenoides]SEU08183.1 DNA-binding transcriptional regulator, XRE-family HTH domain [Lacrimispora sphenoides]